MRNWQATISGLVMLIGLLVLIAGIIYLTVQAKSLPSFMDPIHGDAGHRSERGLVGVIVGAVLLVAGAIGARLSVSRAA